jgi:hypothetical protein
MDDFPGHGALHERIRFVVGRKIVFADSYADLRGQQVVYTMASGRYPVLVQQSTSAPVRTGESEERRPPHRHLPRPTAERRVSSANNSDFVPGMQGRRTASVERFMMIMSLGRFEYGGQ